MVGTCIGYYNQRYFVMLTFYIGLASILGFHYSRQRILSLSDLRSDFHWTEHLLPLTMKHFFFGRISLLELVLMFYCYTFAWTTIMGTGFFFVQMMIIFLGKTFHEFKKEKRTRSYRTVSENFMEVFGPCWVANFILPMQLVFRQKEFDQPFLPNKRHSTVLENGVNGHSQEQSDHVVISM
ncbi:hypothetical protein EB796_024191 [Bugula neritina]|uniref:Palmitoyltransferase n=1 Tax=Bugula neritina TaxID=10212 RepID=A0A7J7IU90_BUGNE|nr:hypothetical protein EB796_024191 [Bugula neritina]